MRKALRTAGLITAPAAAHAAFTVYTPAPGPVSMLALASTAGTFRVDCTRNATGPYHSLILTPVTLGAVAGATSYLGVLTGPKGSGPWSPSSREATRSSM